MMNEECFKELIIYMIIYVSTEVSTEYILETTKNVEIKKNNTGVFISECSL